MKRKISSDRLSSSKKRRKVVKLEIKQESLEAQYDTYVSDSESRGGMATTAETVHTGENEAPSSPLESVSTAQETEESRHESRKRSHTAFEEIGYPDRLTPEAETSVLTSPSPRLTPKAGQRKNKAAVGRSRSSPPSPVSEEKDRSSSRDGKISEPIAKKPKQCHSHAAELNFGPTFPPKRMDLKAGFKSSLDKLPREVLPLHVHS